MNPVISLHNVEVKRNNEIIFQDINWEISEKENWVIIGNSGSGKTSLFRTMEGKYPVTGGEIISYFGGIRSSGTFYLSKHIAFVYCF